MAYFMNHGLEVIDLILLAVIFIGWPLAGSISQHFFPLEKYKDDPDVRLNTYNQTMMILWATALPILIWWALSPRPWADLGFQYTRNLQTDIVTGLTLVLIAYFIIELLRALLSSNLREKFRKKVATIKDMDVLMPSNGKEHRRSMMVSVTAGITEEIIFRGFTIWALSQFMHIWLAGLVSMGLFIFLHRYQGINGMVQVAMITSVVTVLFLVSGSLWPVIALHIAVDVLNISRAYVCLNEGNNTVAVHS